MKKILVIIMILLFITGCSNIKKLSYDQIVNNITTKKGRINTYRTGYKYYLPNNMSVSNSISYNDTLDDGKYTYYLYVDLVSYYNKVTKEYNINNNAIYSTTINNGDKYGYVEVNLTDNNQYLVEIMYNYAKIEVIVDNDDIKTSMLSIINILKSIEYNDTVISNMFGNNALNFVDEELDIFKVKGKSNKNYIQAGDNSDIEIKEDKVPDLDLIK